MTQTILYYPTISIPNTEWLRQALLYFDKVSSIAPRVLWGVGGRERSVPLTPELEYLWNEGVYEPLDPEILSGEAVYAPIVPEGVSVERELKHLGGWPAVHRLTDRFAAKLQNENFEVQPNATFVRMHKGKLQDAMLSFLENKGLLKYDGDRWHGEWFLVEEKTANLYMSMLAQALADNNPESMVPGTDRPECENWIYRARTQEDSNLCIETHIRKVLPVPRDDVPFENILDFKRKRNAELLQYRTKVDELQKQLSQADTPKAVTEALRKFEEAQDRELTNFSKALEDAKIVTRWGSVKTLINAKSPALWGGLLVTGGIAANIAALPISLVVLGTVVAGVVEVKSYFAEKRSEEHKLNSASPFAYLYQARKEGLV
jgi:hypothetical protein